MTTVREVLIAARAKIAQPWRRCRGAMARDSLGNEVDPRSDSAASFSAEGSVFAITGVDPEGSGFEGAEPTLAALHALDEQVGGGRIGKREDGMSHAEILSLFDRAIAARGAA